MFELREEDRGEIFKTIKKSSSAREINRAMAVNIKYRTAAKTAEIYRQALFHAEQAELLNEDVIEKTVFCANFYWATDNLQLALEWYSKAEALATRLYDDVHPLVTDIHAKKTEIEEEAHQEVCLDFNFLELD